MSTSIQTISASITAIPALFWFLMAILANNGDYYWPTYFIVCGAFVVISFLVGLSIPGLFKNAWAQHPAIWIFLQGGMGWIIALTLLLCLNLTPLCIGQNNGDGNNDISLCILQTVLVGVVYSPIEFIFLIIGSILGGSLIKNILENPSFL